MAEPYFYKRKQNPDGSEQFVPVIINVDDAIRELQQALALFAKNSSYAGQHVQTALELLGGPI